MAALHVSVFAPDGGLAAFCLGWFDSETRTGELEPVGTHPAHRRRGLALAAVRECMRRLRAAGATACIVYSAGRDDRTLDLYATAGFTPFDRNVGHVMNR